MTVKDFHVIVEIVFVNGFHFRMNIVLMYNGKLLLHFDV